MPEDKQQRVNVQIAKPIPKGFFLIAMLYHDGQSSYVTIEDRHLETVQCVIHAAAGEARKPDDPPDTASPFGHDVTMCDGTMDLMLTLRDGVDESRMSPDLYVAVCKQVAKIEGRRNAAMSFVAEGDQLMTAANVIFDAIQDQIQIYRDGGDPREVLERMAKHLPRPPDDPEPNTPA